MSTTDVAVPVAAVNATESKTALETALGFARLCDQEFCSIDFELRDLARRYVSKEMRKLTADDACKFIEQLGAVKTV
jgi:hypothetical protein